MKSDRSDYKISDLKEAISQNSTPFLKNKQILTFETTIENRLYHDKKIINIMPIIEIDKEI